MRLGLVTIFALSFVVSSGCGPSKPDGFPALKSCQVTVTDGGTPIAGAMVHLTPKTSMSSLFMTGTTDSNGVAVISTRRGEFERPGAPEGDYSVIINKDVTVDMPSLSEEESNRMTPKQQEDWNAEFEKKKEAGRIIPKILEDPAQTPLTLQVGTAAASLTVDVSQHKK